MAISKEPADGGPFPYPRGAARLRRCFYFALLLAGSAFAGDGTETLIRRLADEDPSVRDTAEAELLRLGPEALPDLDRFASTCGWRDAEGSTRVASIAARIREDAAWAEGERKVRAALEDRMCPHCVETARVRVLSMRDEALRSALPGRRIFAVTGECCAAASGWTIVDESGAPLSLRDLAAAMPPAAGEAAALEALSALEALFEDPGRFREIFDRSEPRVISRDGGKLRVSVGVPGNGHEWEFDAAGKVRQIEHQSW